MANQITIVCPHCQKEFPLTDALSHEYEIKAEAKIKQELELAMKDKVNEAEELRKQNKELQTQFLELNKTIRELQRNNEIEMQKRLTQEGDRLLQEHKLKEAEKEKIIADLKTALEEAQKKASQGSQQTQGEVQELILEEFLQREFPQDRVTPVAKGVRGGDVIQVVVDKNGQGCGTILWESKQTKAWSDGWVTKLKEDQRSAHADLAIIISAVLPEKIKSLGYYSGVWVTGLGSALGACWALRYHLVQAANIRRSSEASRDDKDELYRYVTGTEFAHRVEAMMDAYAQFIDEIETQKRHFAATWAKQEKSIRTLMEQTGTIHGELAGIVGKALPDVRNLSLETGGEEK
jgi:hypothetical protein